MSIALSYPGVYIEELSSGQHTITGVATSIAAFVGWAPQGPMDEAVMVESWSEYQALYGGLIPGVYLGYAVYQFFLNGGSQAYIVRMVWTDAETASSTISGLALYASNPGDWANSIGVSISNVNSIANTFNLQVTNASGQTLESYTNLSISPTNPQFAVAVINSDSSYITFTPPGKPAPTSITLPTATTKFTVNSTVRGTVSGSVSFISGEQVVQNTTTASAYLLGTVNSSGPMAIGPVTGASPSIIDDWVGIQSGAIFKPSALPVVIDSPTSILLNKGTSSNDGSDGSTLIPGDGNFETQLKSAQGYSLLANVPIFNLLCVPGESSATVVPDLQKFCAQYRAFLIVDSDIKAVVGTGSTGLSSTGPADGSGNTLVNQYADNSAFYFPWVLAPDPAKGFRPTLFPPCGFVAGIYAATDASRGVWKAPAGINSSLTGALGLQFTINDQQNGLLNPMGVNCLRQFRNIGNVVWGSRTIAGSDEAGSQWKHVPIRRLALFLESSLYYGTQWVVFEPNDEPLWGQIRMNVGAFMQGLFLQGAFAGTTPRQAYFVKCDKENNLGPSVALGIVNITVGFAPLYPAEFVVIQIQQMLNN